MSRTRAKRHQPPPPPAQRDLIVLAADKDTAQAMEGIFSRPESLSIRTITANIIVHPNHDPGCYGQSTGLIRPHMRTHTHALVVFDREGSGQEAMTREDLETEVETQLAIDGWSGRAAVVVVDPELDNWVWSRSPHVPTALGWHEGDFRQWLVDTGFLDDVTQAKPARPKEAMEAVLRHVRKARSSAIYREIAMKVSLSSCTDPAFVKLRHTLQVWFPTL